MKKRPSAEQIVAKLRQADAELGKGLKVSAVLRSFHAIALTEPPSESLHLAGAVSVPAP